MQTPKHYMSFRPVSEEPKKEKYITFVNPGFVPSDYESDQAIQNNKLYMGAQIGNFEEPKVWPCETFTLALDATSMDMMWEGLLEDASPMNKGMILKNVHYVSDQMQKEFEKEIRRDSRPSYNSNKTLYFTNTSLAFGLLGKGKLYGEGVYFLDCPKCFVTELVYPPLPFFQTSFIDVIKTNFYTRSYNPNVDYLSEVLQDFFRRNELIRIHQSIGSYGLPSLPSAHQKKIVEMLDADEKLEERRDKINTYLKDLGQRYQDQQSYLSLSGWMDTFWYREWK